jgi:2-aminomuconate deaminase
MDIRSQTAAPPVGRYPHAKKVGNLLFLSGIGPRNLDSSIPGNVYDSSGKLQSYDFEQQVHSVFANVQKVLREAGLELRDLVDVTVFLTDMPRDFKAYNALWAHYFTDFAPARTTLGISHLPTPIAIELKCIAAFPEHV